jgi:hypothetical protein
MRRVKWPVYPQGDPRSLGLVLAMTLSAPFTAGAVPLIIKGTCELGGEPVPSEAILGAGLLFLSSVVMLPVAFKVFSSFMRRVVVRPDCLEVRKPFGAEFVRSDEVSELVVSDDTVVLKTVDGREVRFQVLDTEGFAETVRRLWGFEFER